MILLLCNCFYFLSRVAVGVCLCYLCFLFVLCNRNDCVILSILSCWKGLYVTGPAVFWTNFNVQRQFLYRFPLRETVVVDKTALPVCLSSECVDRLAPSVVPSKKEGPFAPAAHAHSQKVGSFNSYLGFRLQEAPLVCRACTHSYRVMP